MSLFQVLSAIVTGGIVAKIATGVGTAALSLLGFSPTGIIAGSIAASLQGAAVASGSLFSFLQGAAMTGGLALTGPVGVGVGVGTGLLYYFW